MSDPPSWFPGVGRPINPDPLATQPRPQPHIPSRPLADDGWQSAPRSEYYPPPNPAPQMEQPVANDLVRERGITNSVPPNPSAVPYDPRPVDQIPTVERPPAEPQQAKFEIPAERWDSLAPEALESRPGFAPLGDQARNGRAAALGGFCPVSLVEREKWVEGDAGWGAVHNGRTYLFAGPEEQRRFLQNPERYSPALAGNDPVLALDEQQTVPGNLDFSVVFDGRLYMFSSRASLARFRANPQRYSDVEEVP